MEELKIILTQIGFKCNRFGGFDKYGDYYFNIDHIYGSHYKIINYKLSYKYNFIISTYNIEDFKEKLKIIFRKEIRKAKYNQLLN